MRFATKTRLPWTPFAFIVKLAIVCFFMMVGFGSPDIAIGAPSVEVTFVKGIQPGWVRAYANYELANLVRPGVRFLPSVVCKDALTPDLVTTTVARVDSENKRVIIDIKSNLAYFEERNFRVEPCVVKSITVDMKRGDLTGEPLASHTLPIGFNMGLPFSHRHFMQLEDNSDFEFEGSVSLSPGRLHRRYAAFPPQTIAVRKGTWQTFLEVEELPESKTLGVRRLSSFQGWNLMFELGAGGEVFDGWGIDVHRRGIVKPETYRIERINPGHDTFPDGIIYPAPPLYPEREYYRNVLDNRFVPRVIDPLEEIDVIYDNENHRLVAVNGAKILELESGPIMPWTGTTDTLSSLEGGELIIPQAEGPFSIVPFNPKTPLVVSTPHLTHPIPHPNSLPIAARLVEKINSFAGELRPEDMRGLKYLSGVTPSSSRVFAEPTFSRPRAPGQEDVSPQEFLVEQEEPLFNSRYFSARTASGTKRMLLSPTMTRDSGSGGGGAQTPMAQNLSSCEGWSNPDFICPTWADPIPIETFPSRPDGSNTLMLWDTLTPYLQSQGNLMGTCGTHASMQYIEILYNRYGLDLGRERVITVDGEQILVPWPRISFSTTGSLVQLYTEMGSRDGEVPIWMAKGSDYWTARNYEELYPVFLDAYWPARELYWTEWANRWNDNGLDLNQDIRDQLLFCRERYVGSEKSKFWRSGFCLGQGHAPAGIYRNYSRGRFNKTIENKPLSALPWSLGTIQLPIVVENVGKSITPHAPIALRRIVNDLDRGLPMRLSYSAGAESSIADGWGGQYTGRSGPTWFVPRELGGNTRKELRDALQLNGGHAVLIVGYTIDGDINGNYDPYESYFIIQNNWGKNSGYKSFFFINFAAFEVLTYGLEAFRIDKHCPSVACVGQ